jgi:hypothetical protein
MKVKDLFTIKYGVNLELITLETVPVNDKDGVNFVARTSENNGVVARVRKIDGLEPQPAWILSCAGSGSVLSTFVLTEPFYSGRDLYTLTPRKKMSLQEKQYYCMCIKANAYRYSYGRQANKTLKDIELLDTLPEWVKVASIETIKTSVKKRDVALRLFEQWKEFKLGEIFTITGTKTTKINVLNEYGNGEYSYVTTQSTNNAVDGYYDFYTENGNVLTIDSAVLGFCSYQAKNFSASDHVEKLTPKFDLNKHIALFLVTIINREQYKYSYGRKCNQTKIKDTIIKLPVTPQGLPDWNYMENYIKALPYSDRI